MLKKYSSKKLVDSGVQDCSTQIPNNKSVEGMQGMHIITSESWANPCLQLSSLICWLQDYLYRSIIINIYTGLEEKELNNETIGRGFVNCY